MFPSLKYLKICAELDPDVGFSESPFEVAFKDFMRVVARETQLVSIRLGKKHFYRPRAGRTMKEWEQEVIIDLEDEDESLEEDWDSENHSGRGSEDGLRE